MPRLSSLTGQAVNSVHVRDVFCVLLHLCRRHASPLVFPAQPPRQANLGDWASTHPCSGGAQEFLAIANTKASSTPTAVRRLRLFPNTVGSHAPPGSSAGVCSCPALQARVRLK